MRNVNVSTNSDIRPLLMSFTPETVAEPIKAEDYNVMYDPKNQISYFLGGGNSNPRNSTSQKGYRKTEEVVHWITNGNGVGAAVLPISTETYNDAPVMTDD
jgi:hypothetical protein